MTQTEKKQEFVESMLPEMQALLEKAYQQGYNDGASDSAAPQYNNEVVDNIEYCDLGLVSGTKWGVMSQPMAYMKTVALKLQLPTREQVEELKKSCMSNCRYDSGKGTASISIKSLINDNELHAEQPIDDNDDYYSFWVQSDVAGKDATCYDPAFEMFEEYSKTNRLRVLVVKQG